MEKLGFRRWHRQLWGTGAHGPSTSNNLFFLLHCGAIQIMIAAVCRYLQDFAQHTVTGIRPSSLFSFY